MEENEIVVFKKKLVDYKNKQHWKIFSEVLKSAEEHLEIDYKEEGVFKKKYLICRADFGKKIFWEERDICDFFIQLIDKKSIN